MADNNKPLVLATPKHAEEFISNDKVWSDGSLQLVSSDLVRFKVPPYFLFANSIVFRDMGEGAISTPIHFTDPNIESATVLRDVLKLFTDWELPADLAGSLYSKGGELVMRVVWIHHFLVKYDCPGPLKILKSLMEEKRKKQYLYGILDFLYCSNIDDIEGCDKRVIAEGNISYDLYRHIPAPYFWALLQTSVSLEKSTRSGATFKGQVSIAQQAHTRESAAE